MVRDGNINSHLKDFPERPLSRLPEIITTHVLDRLGNGYPRQKLEVSK